MAIYELFINSSTLSLIGALLAVCLAADYWKKSYFMRNGIPGPLSLPVVGTLFSFTKGFTTDIIEKQKKYGKVFGMYFGGPILIITDVDILQEVMISKFSSFPNHKPPPFRDRPFDKAVTNARDGHWKLIRNTLTPAFTANKLKQMNDLINECCDRLVKNFEAQKGKEGGIQCKDLFGQYSMEVVASVFYGLQIDSQNNPDDPFVKHAKRAFNFSAFNLKLLLAFMVPGASKVMELLDVSFFDPKAKDFFTSVISQTLELRKKGEVKRMDILQLMADAHKLDSTDEDEEGTDTSPSRKHLALSYEEIMANASMFLMASYETTNTSLCYASYMLATHPVEQEKLFEEVTQFAPTREDLTYEVLTQMEYLDGFVKETLRMFPPVAGVDRFNDKGDIKIKDVLIPKGFVVMVPVYPIHYDPELWESPEEFRPERFNKENKSKIHPLSWLPFGDGPRSCIGMRLAMMEIKFAVVRLVQAFKIETCPETEIPLVMNTVSMLTSPPNGVKVQVVSREMTSI